MQLNVKLRSSTVITWSLFTCLGTAFLLVDPQEVPGSLEESGLLEKIETFVQVHRDSFLILYAPFNGRKELEIMLQTQHR